MPSGQEMDQAYSVAPRTYRGLNKKRIFLKNAEKMIEILHAAALSSFHVICAK